MIRDNFDTYARVNAMSSAGDCRGTRLHISNGSKRTGVCSAPSTQETATPEISSEFGLTSNRDGSYSVDLGKYPRVGTAAPRSIGFGSRNTLGSMSRHLRFAAFAIRISKALRAYVAGSPPRNQASIWRARRRRRMRRQVRHSLRRNRKPARRSCSHTSIRPIASAGRRARVGARAARCARSAATPANQRQISIFRAKPATLQSGG